MRDYAVLRASTRAIITIVYSVDRCIMNPLNPSLDAEAH